MKSSFSILSIIVMTGFLSSCGDIKAEKLEALKTGKKLENIRIKICLLGCDQKAATCFNDVESDITQGLPVAELNSKLDACREQRSQCSRVCLDAT